MGDIGRKGPPSRSSQVENVWFHNLDRNKDSGLRCVRVWGEGGREV